MDVATTDEHQCILWLYFFFST